MGTHHQGSRMYPSAEEINCTDDVMAEDMEAGGSGADEKVYFAVGKNVKDCKQNLAWVVKNFPKKTICFVHVLQPSPLVPFMGGKFPASKLQGHVVTAHRERERENMREVLNKYLVMLRITAVKGEEVHIEKDKVEEGIVELISLHGIRRLVMGAAADKHYHKKMTHIKSQTAKFVYEQGVSSCHIWFICKGRLIQMREAAGVSGETGSDIPLNFSNSSDRRTMSDVSTLDGTQWVDSPQSSIVRRYASDLNGMMTRSTSQSSFISASSFSASEVPSAPSLDLVPNEDNNVVDQPLDDWNEGEFFSIEKQPEEFISNTSTSRVQERLVDDELYERLEQAMTEAENAKRDAFEESLRRRKAEKELVEANRRAKSAEKIYAEEMKRMRKELEDTIYIQKQELEKNNNQQVTLMEQLDGALREKSLLESEIAESKKIVEDLLIQKQELEKNNNQQGMLMEELNITLKDKSILENEIAESKRMVEELQDEMVSAVELLKTYRNERNEMEAERDALIAAEELRQQAQGSSSSAILPQFVLVFSYSEIEDATRKFHPSLKIGEGGYGRFFKGILNSTEVAIKVLHGNHMECPSEYRQEVDVLSRLRHANIVTLIGACPEAFSLIYEYLPNGNLEDRLNCKDNSSPLPWRTRIRIAYELCSVLVFLHSCKPHCLVHGNLKPSNILLGANFITKVTGFGNRLDITPDQSPTISTTSKSKTQSSGSVLMRMLNDKDGYSDHYITPGESTPQSDIYSFGIILLRLLTGKRVWGITREVQRALDNKTLDSLLDSSAGDWPFLQAQQLAYLAVRCAGNRKIRPDLASEVLTVLEPLRALGEGSSNKSQIVNEEQGEAPSHFICPIFQEVMQDPQVAADGYTYEAGAIQGWLGSGHDTSPMTNQKLAHKNLVPNLTLRSAIQEWLH